MFMHHVLDNLKEIQNHSLNESTNRKKPINTLQEGIFSSIQMRLKGFKMMVALINVKCH